jgi:predicted RNase H-like HicB family nuclease
MSYPSLSDKARTPAARLPVVTPGQPRAAVPESSLRTQSSQLRSSGSALPPSNASGGTRQQPVGRLYNRSTQGGPSGAPPAEPPIDPMSAFSGPTPAGRLSASSATGAPRVLDVGEPYPSISGRGPEGFGNPNMDRRITPRSPRAALEPEHVPVPTRRSKRVRNPLVIVGNAIFTLLILLVLGGGAAVVFGKLRFEAPGPLQADKMVNIPQRAGLVEIADILQKEGVMDEHRLVFIGGVFALKARTELKSGEYLFPKRASVRDVVETMVEGKVVQHLVTIPEGLTSEQIAARLLDSQVLTGTIKDTPREGSMLPNSYAFRRGDTREQAVQRMQQAQQQVLKEAWERRARDLPVRTPEQLIILASIIEKETSRPEERTRVAAVFANRLKQKMR